MSICTRQGVTVEASRWYKASVRPKLALAAALVVGLVLALAAVLFAAARSAAR